MASGAKQLSYSQTLPPKLLIALLVLCIHAVAAS